VGRVVLWVLRVRDRRLRRAVRVSRLVLVLRPLRVVLGVRELAEWIGRVLQALQVLRAVLVDRLGREAPLVRARRVARLVLVHQPVLALQRLLVVRVDLVVLAGLLGMACKVVE